MRLILLLHVFLSFVAAETGLDGWLRYANLSSDVQAGASLPSTLVVLNDTQTSPVYTAGQELQKGIQGILGKKLSVAYTITNGTSALIVGTVESFKASGILPPATSGLEGDGFYLDIGAQKTQIVGKSERGALYGAFEYLSMIAQGNFTTASYVSNPGATIRWVNQWDNLDGTIERGFAGKSIFFSGGRVVDDLTRVSQYARLLASVRINGIIVNNVNADANLLSATNLGGLGRIADAMRPYGVRVGISLNFDSPKSAGGLSTSDPLNAQVIKFWNDKTTALYKYVPDLAGFLVKANSENQPGPITYGRTLSDGANLFAQALKPHGNAIVMFRAFVYDQLSESNWKSDRANAAVDYFKKLDGHFDDNVVVQIKYGPIDFQVREPVSPLFANLRNTSSAIELQVSQEYLGQQNHLVYLPPLWKTILDFDLKVDGKESLVGRDILTGQTFNRQLSGYAAVVNVGLSTNWLGHHLAMSNLYAYGRLAWDSSADEIDVLQDWTRLTFGTNNAVVDTITSMSMRSWPAYENYTGNLGIQTLTDITGPHYGPNPATQDGNGWGQWTRADAVSIGMDRTVSNGTGFSGQYPAEIAAMYEKIETTPDNLLLWFHHVPYSQRLKSGETVIQHFYNAHYAGADTVQSFPSQWSQLKGLIDDERFDAVAFKLQYQTGHAIVWRDAINTFYRQKSSIADEKGRVGNHTWRIEAKMQLSGYQVVSVDPPIAASGSQAIRATSNGAAGTAKTMLAYPSGTYDIAVNYFDIAGGKARYEMFLNDKSIGTWVGNLEDTLGNTFSSKPDGGSATRIYFRNVDIVKGDVLKISGKADGSEAAWLDYVSVLPIGVVD